MSADPRFALVAGPYRPPRCRPGGKLLCELRDRLVVVKRFTDARIPWPATNSGRGGRYAPVVTRELGRAIRTESNQAVAYWFGISPGTVTRWRRRLGVPRFNPGTARLDRELVGARLGPEALAKAAAAWTEGRRAKIAAAKRGRPAPPQVAERLRTAWLGRKHTPEARAKMSAASRRKGNTWPADHLALLGTLPDDEVAGLTGRSENAVRVKRTKLRIPPAGGWKRERPGRSRSSGPARPADGGA